MISKRASQTRKRGQMKLSFGMIFSIILIIVFVSFAFFAIGKFLDIQSSVQVGKFGNDFQSDIDAIWKGSQASKPVEYTLDKKITHVCFSDYSSNFKGSSSTMQTIYNELELVYYGNENLFFYPVGSGQGLDGKNMKHVNLEATTKNENPFCVENINGKVNFIIKKDFSDAEVTITK